ncbi:ABC transporter permease [Ornithinimicrobium avium]|uniref:ABC transporter permease n=1 Tax=Ornithinimicrobium avium TaxID=2283195 RepID=A0A345NMW5_9MICO|nr:ABC transporter permease [Ornithinimicrobium avium]AXH96373.1 ABC transporter permease [Ornithinimicrobium avium]
MTIESQIGTGGEDLGVAPAPRWGLPRYLLRRPSAVLAIAVLAVVVLLAVLAPLLARWSGNDPYAFNQDALGPAGLPAGPLGGISADHWLGVEPLNGRDLLSRILYGGRTSLFIATAATVLTMLVGTVLGLVAGYFGGWTDQVISRVMDFLMAFPQLIFMIAILSAVPGANRIAMLIAVLSIFGWPKIGRVVRSQVLSLRQREFVEAAVASGASRGQIVFREILPSLTGTIIVYTSLTFPIYIATEAGLSFLGVGVKPPQPSWGQMIYSAVPWYQTDPMFFALPGTFLTLTVLSAIVLDDHLQNFMSRRGGR